MKVDFTAMWQGVSNACDAGEIDEKLYIALYERVRAKAFHGESGRLLILYSDLLSTLAPVEPTNYMQLVRLWHHLGTSLASGISVASQE